MPPTLPINHYPDPLQDNQLKIGGQGPIPLSHANVFGGRKLNLPALNTLIFSR